MIGNNETLAPYREYNGKFINSNSVYANIYLKASGQNIINIDAAGKYPNLLGIECLTGQMSDESGLLNYYDECNDRYAVAGISDINRFLIILLVLTLLLQVAI